MGRKKQIVTYATRLEDLEDGIYYKIKDVQSILQHMRLPYSIYTIRDYETWKCLDYRCGARHDEEVSTCTKCGGEVRPPIIHSPRTRGGGKGPGHRRYTAEEVRQIVDIFKKRT